MANEIQVFRYNESNITFSMGGSVMVNATEMAKTFGKRPAKWLELPSTLEFPGTLGAVRKSDRLVETVNIIDACYSDTVEVI